jgi:hypothetical protein
MEEIYKDIIGFEGKYQVSNFGNVRTIERVTIFKDGRERHYENKVLICPTDSKGYPKIRLLNFNPNYGSTRRVHNLVWEAFGNGTTISFPDKVIDHIDRNKQNNHISNLRIVSNRENTYNRKGNLEFIGVRKNKKSDNYSCRIGFNYKDYHLGTFKTQEEAFERYNEALSHIDTDFLEWLEIIETPKKSNSLDSRIGVYKSSTPNKFVSYITLNRKLYSLGTFDSDFDARKTFLEAKSQIKNGTFLEWYETLGVKRK